MIKSRLTDPLTDLDTNVSFIMVPAKKGFQAADVTIADPPKKEEAEPENGAPSAAMEGVHLGETNAPTSDTTFGGWGNDASETNGTTTETATETTDGGWGNDASETNETTTETATETTFGGWGSGGW